MIISIFVLALVGFAISVYAYITEKKIRENPLYKPACDINDRISCSKPMQSQYSNLFFISNSLAGMLFYASMAILAFFDMKTFILLGAIGASIATVFLAYLLYVKIKSFCIVCSSLYLINFLLLFFSIIL